MSETMYKLDNEEVLIVRFPVFGYKIGVIMTSDIQKSREARNHFIGAVTRIIGPYVDGLHSYNGLEPDAFIFFTPVATTGTIAHECFHALHRMFRYLGAKIENEVMAYHLGYLLDEVLKLKQPTCANTTSTQNS